MNTPKTSDDVMREMNELARRMGRYPAKPSREIEPLPGSILDVLLTPAAKERIHRLDDILERLQQEQEAEVTDDQQKVRTRVPAVADQPSDEKRPA